MSKSYRDQRGKRTNGEITGHLGRAHIGPDGYFARCHDDNVGSTDSKRDAKRHVTRARRRALRVDVRSADHYA